ncbi:MAG TPA: 4Fe-4S dicluster domain-containing protein [Candidatus Lokiarchaeia archaeon]|nr:4Fe-4S dicluster domain-containing protein [Candidatus Lokiarchaeia archaeon]
MGVDVEFRRKVLDVNIKAKLHLCYQCNRCTTECPVANYADKPYNPKQLILESLLGLKDGLVNAEDNFRVFGCTSCDTCDDVCPGDLELTEVFMLLKNLMVQAGNAPKAYLGQAKAIADSGYAIPLQQAIARRRTQAGLPEPALADPAEIKTLLKEVGYMDRVKQE